MKDSDLEGDGHGLIEALFQNLAGRSTKRNKETPVKITQIQNEFLLITSLDVTCLVTPCSLVDMYKHLGGTCFLHLQGKICRRQVPLKHWTLYTKLNCVISQSTSIIMLNGMGTSNLVKNSTDSLMYLVWALLY
jgi:hypothetical protein